jgi:pimeloyl-ACP methyl ester carboxylesterase
MRFFPRKRPVTWRRRVVEYMMVLPVVYAAYCTALYAMQDRFIFPREIAGSGRPVGSLPRGVESVWIEVGTAERPVRVEAWYAGPTAGAAGGKAPAVVFCHGNAELIDSALDHVRGWRERGYAVLLPEYRGYGRSGGAPCQRDLVADAGRFYDLLAARPEVDAARIVIHGRSLGGGVACQLAAARPCAALVLESTFTSVAGFTWSMGAPPILCTSPFRSDRVLPTLGRPVLILHGAQDEIIPVAQGRRLHEITPGSAYAEIAGGHNDFPADWGAYWRALDPFLSEQGLPAGAATGSPARTGAGSR